MFKISKTNTLLLTALIFTLTSITSYNLIWQKWKTNLPEKFDNTYGVSCRIKLFDDDYAWRTENRFAACSLISNSDGSYKYCKEEFILPFDLTDDLKSVTSLDCICSIKFISEEKGDLFKKVSGIFSSKKKGEKIKEGEFTLKIGENMSARGIKAKYFTMRCFKHEKK